MARMERSPRLLALLGTAILAAACTHPPDDTPERQVEDRLVGTWLREYEQDKATVRRVLVLEQDGTFREMAVASGTAGGTVQFAHSGEWRFDGTNLKRHYRLINGEVPSRPTIPFATFEVRFQTADEFLGVDNVHRLQVRYHRVAAGTLP